MKKATITINLDEEKVNALRLYLAQRDCTPESELEKAAEVLYSKYVPAGVREFIELNAGSKVLPKPKKPKTVPSSAAGAGVGSDGDLV